MIPCLGVLVLNRGDLLLRMIDSIDQPVARLCIVQNGSDDTVADAIAQVAAGRNRLIEHVYVQRPFRNMGVGPAWNSIIKAFPECDYWLISNNDTLFLPGDLEQYHDLWQTNTDSIIVSSIGAYNCFVISPHVVAKVGLFDENIWPIYCEDLDYMIRAQRAGVQQICINSNVGENNNGSWTIRSNPHYAASNNTTQANNSRYVEEKWGADQSHSTPWNHSSRDHRDWWYNPYQRREHSAVWQNFEQTANRIS